ncbi:hypothetical protein ACJMK2_043570 [Sinanodonta woodiana]|uniref:Uncharacterized protein n=1 Tax=Sinanodonta woodiana TaxID=1069815 RepID=A0ABD3VXA7_SINWO
MKLHGRCLILLLFSFSIAIADQVLNYTGVYVKVLETSGKIEVGNTLNMDADPNAVKLQFAEIREKDSNGSSVGRNAVTAHTISSFANRSFSFSNTTDAKYQNISATMCNFTINLAPVTATLLTTVYIFKESGNITDANETTNIKVGNVKFIFTIMNWKFCGSPGVTCRDIIREVGQYIDFSIVLNGNWSASNATKGTNDGDMYNLGGGAGIILSKKVKYDAKYWTNMTVGYPTMMKTGEDQTFTFRFEKFNSSAVYSLTVAAGGFDSENGKSIGGNGTTVSTTVRATVGAIVRRTPATISTTVRANSGNALSIPFLLAILTISLISCLLCMM